MKRIIVYLLLTCMVLTLAACGDNGSKTPETPKTEITLQEVYDAGKSLDALIGDHENVYVQVVSDGKIIREEYLSKSYKYSYSGPEYMDMGFEYVDFITDHAEYICFDNIYALNVTLTPDGTVDMKERFSEVKTSDFISNEVLKDEDASITESDGYIIVTTDADTEDLVMIGDDVVSCQEIYTLDAETREMTAVKTIYTYKDGKVEEGVVTITRDVDVPERAKAFLAYEQDTENTRTLTIVSNSGTADEKTESFKTPKGLLVAFSPKWDVEGNFTLYSDAACTQEIEGDLDVNSDLTVYIKWSK